MLGDNHQKYNYDGKPLTREILEQAKVKQSLVSLIGTLGELPVELVKEIGLKKINMITIPNKKVAGYADIDVGDTYHFDPTKFFGTGLIHEAYHLYDVNHSDPLTMRWDRGFRKLNPSEQIYTAEFIKSPNYGDYISKEEYDALTVKGDDTKKAAKVVVSSDYSFTNVAEDKAELGSNVLNSFLISGVLDRKMPILRRKALFL